MHASDLKSRAASCIQVSGVTREPIVPLDGVQPQYLIYRAAIPSTPAAPSRKAPTVCRAPPAEEVAEASELADSLADPLAAGSVDEAVPFGRLPSVKLAVTPVLFLQFES